MDEIIEILKSNYNCENNSFIYFLHEKNIFNETAFHEYYSCLKKIAKNNINKETDKEITRMIIQTCNDTLKLIIYSLSDKDKSIITNLNHIQIHHYIERLTGVIEAYLGGYEFDETLYNE